MMASREYPFYAALVDGEFIGGTGANGLPDMVARIEHQYEGHDIAWGVQVQCDAELERVPRESLIH